MKKTGRIQMALWILGGCAAALIAGRAVWAQIPPANPLTLAPPGRPSLITPVRPPLISPILP